MNEIHRCPNCAYLLVLLENRRKYKCASCGKLFLQKEIEEQSFRRWNKKMKELDKHNLKLENKKPKLSPEEKRLRVNEFNRKWRLNNPEKCRKYYKKYYTKNKEKWLKKNGQYYESNKEKIAQQRKIYKSLRREAIKKRREEYKEKFPEKVRLLNRIGYYRMMQGRLVVGELEKLGLNRFNSCGFR